MKTLIKILCLSLFSIYLSDTIVFLDSFDETKTLTNIKITKINDTEIHYTKSLGILGNKTTIIQKEKLISFTINEEDSIDENNSETPKQNTTPKITEGLGFNVGKGEGIGVYISIESEDGLLFEPYITYSNSSTKIDYNGDDEDYDTSTSIWSFSIGVFKLSEKKNVRSYAGLRIGRRWGKFEESIPYYNNAEVETEFSEWIWGPAIGAEWFLNDNFTFGSEAMLRISNEELEDDEYGSEITRTWKTINLEPKFIIRYYF